MIYLGSHYDGEASLTIASIQGRFELFLDLLYVAILANFAENLAEHPSGAHVVKYIVSGEKLLMAHEASPSRYFRI